MLLFDVSLSYVSHYHRYGDTFIALYSSAIGLVSGLRMDSWIYSDQLSDELCVYWGLLLSFGRKFYSLACLQVYLATFLNIVRRT